MGAHHTTEFRNHRAIVIWLHNANCFICRRFSYDLEVHHIDKNPKNNEFTNLMPLCKKHHVTIGKCSKLKPFTQAYIKDLIIKKANSF